MTTVYPRWYLDKYETQEHSFSYPKTPDAKQQRDAMARQLRKEGWTVKSRTTHFNGDLCTGDLYSLMATRERDTEQFERPWILFDCICISARAGAVGEII